MADYLGCASPSDTDESNDWARNYNATGVGGSWDEGEWFACGVAAADAGQWATPYSYTSGQIEGSCAASGLSTCRKKVTGTRWSDLAGEIFRLRMTYVVCYRYNGGIVSVRNRYDEVLNSGRYPWQYKGPVDGYPRHFRYEHMVEFQFRHKMGYCVGVFSISCFGDKFPYVVIRFYDNNTAVKENYWS